jgi:hypothetical protein
VGEDKIDASLGLAFSLVLFERYRKNGLLQAELHHVPGLPGRCKGYLHLVEGKVVACYIEDKQGRRHAISKDTLSQLDNERGPFEWSLTPLPSPPSPSPQIKIFSRPMQSSPTPRCIVPLPLEKLDGWTYSQKMMLSIVFDAIDGQRTIEDIKANTPLPPSVVEEALRVLLALQVITISS